VWLRWGVASRVPVWRFEPLLELRAPLVRPLELLQVVER